MTPPVAIKAWAIKAPDVGNGTMTDYTSRFEYMALIGFAIVIAGIEIIYRCVGVTVQEMQE